MTYLLSTMSLGGLITLLYAIFVFVILYITIDKYGYIANVVIYALVRTLLPFILMSPKNFSIILVFLLYAVVGFLIVIIVSMIRDNFEYDTIVWFIFSMIFAESLILLLLKGVLSLFT